MSKQAGTSKPAANALTAPQKSWLDNVRVYGDGRAIAMLLLGLSAGLPILLIFSSLSLWLREAGVARSAVTYFSWAALGYSFKFIWAPLVDVLPLPLLTRYLGQRRSWLLLSQIMVVAAIIAMASVNPAASTNGLTMMAIAAVALGFSSATQDIVIDAFRIESAPESLQSALSGAYVAGYRVGMILAGAGTLYLAQHLGSSMETYSYAAWRTSYLIMAAIMLIGILTTLLRPEPEVQRRRHDAFAAQHYISFFLLFCAMVLAFIFVYRYTNPLITDLFLQDAFKNAPFLKFLIRGAQFAFAVLSGAIIAILAIRSKLVDKKLVISSYLDPVKSFCLRYDRRTVVLLLALIGVYRISDIVLGVIANVFYQDLGFSKNEIATIVKTFGLVMTLVGGLVGGALVKQLGLMNMLFLGALLSAATNLIFMVLAHVGHDTTLLYVVISVDNLAAGLASAAFITFLGNITDVSFTARQYAILSSLMLLFPKLIGGYSGTLVDALDYDIFFLLTALMGLPVLWVVHKCRHFNLKPD